MTAAFDRHLLVAEDISVHIPSGGGTVRAVDRVSLSLERGKTLALVGESGSGKSMLCRAILGIPPGRAATRGRIIFGERDLAQLPEKELNAIRGREIGVVLQNPMSSLNPVLKVGWQIAEPMLRHLGISLLKARERAVELLGAVGIPRPAERVDCYPHQLSGGMRQRVAIAIALACDPQLLIADEPTTALDVTVQAEILNLLGRLQMERRMAMILVSHDLGVVAGRAHETAVMYAGRIVEQAPTVILFDQMRMRYTRALFDSIPRLDAPSGQPLASIGGQLPDLAAELQGCRFAPRCRRAEDRCFAEEPPLVADGLEDHRFACWFPCEPGISVTPPGPLLPKRIMS
ncbi:MAG: ABC transporter ATP-binding protein [Geobacter sp.]|nr:ABC transporter ATP-binding protein [Geobacter sp.]